MKQVTREARCPWGDTSFLRVAGEDHQFARQPHIRKEPAHDAEDVAANIVHPVGRQAFVNELADVKVFADPADPQESRIFGGDVFPVWAAQ